MIRHLPLMVVSFCPVSSKHACPMNHPCRSTKLHIEKARPKQAGVTLWNICCRGCGPFLCLDVVVVNFWRRYQVASHAYHSSATTSSSDKWSSRHAASEDFCEDPFAK